MRGHPTQLPPGPRFRVLVGALGVHPGWSSVLLLGALVSASPVSGQILDQTMVPSGNVRFQVNPVFISWDSRFGRLPDGSSVREDLGDELTDPTALSLFPGIPTLTQMVSSATGISDYVPTLGSVSGRITQDVTRVDFGGHIGVFDWLTIGGVLPWTRARTVVDHLFVPDSINGDLGLNPVITNPTGVDAFLVSATSAYMMARANAGVICAGGSGATCTAANDLADRATSFEAYLRTAYDASPFFPIVGSSTGDALSAAASALDADLIAAGLIGLGTPLALATDWLTSEGFGTLPTTDGAGIDATPLETRRNLWAAGDVEVSARLMVLDNLRPSPDEAAPGLGYRVMATFTARLPTGLAPHPDVLFDVGTGQAQTDLEGGLTAFITLGSRIGLGLGGRYGTQGSTTLTKRVAPHELAMPPASTRAQVTWAPGSYFGLDAAPTIRVSPELSITGEYRYFNKRRDRFALTLANPELDPMVLGIESGVKAHQVGVGVRYDTVGSWLAGDASRPMELHLRLLQTRTGGGGQTPIATRVEAGLRLFKRFWGSD